MTGALTGQERPDQQRPTPALRVKKWSEMEFASGGRLWNELLAKSDADPLFMSWDWQSLWWTRHAGMLAATLHVAAVYAGRELVGIAPFYSHTVRVRRLLISTRLEIIGIAWRDSRPVYSDYLDIIAARAYAPEVTAALADWLKGEPFWDELVLSCTKRGGVADHLASAHLGCMAYVRVTDPMSAWSARLPDRFADYVARLDAPIRRKLFNHRRKLACPRIQFASETEVPDFLDLLWRYSSARWGGTEVCAGPNVGFHLDAAVKFARAGELRLSRLMTREGPRSVLYAVRKADTVYYIHSGFDLDNSRGMSMGYLHFGYAIEAACGEGATRFDFLAGRGRHRDYKQDLLTESVSVATYHAVRRRPIRAMYAVYDRVKRACAR